MTFPPIQILTVSHDENEFLGKRYCKECSHSSSESDIPLAELQRRIRTHKVRERNEQDFSSAYDDSSSESN